MTFIKAPCEACQRELAGELSELPVLDELSIIECACLHHNVAIEIGLLSGAVVHWGTQSIFDEADWRRLMVAKQQIQPTAIRLAFDLVKARKGAH